MMAEHESIGKTDEWYTPEWIFQKMNTVFHLDVCAGYRNTPSNKWCRFGDMNKGLESLWRGLIWMNPPFGKRNGVLPWVEKFIDHGNGVAILPNRTATEWWQTCAKGSEVIVFLKGKVKFIAANGTEGKSPGYGNCLFGVGEGSEVLKQAGFDGILVSV